VSQTTKKEVSTFKLPLLPLRDVIVFPHMMMPLFVGREKSINALEDAMSKKTDIILAAQKEAKTNNPEATDIYSIGTLGSIIQLLRLPDGTVKVLIEGKRRVKINSFVSSENFFTVECEDLPEKSENKVETEALMRSVKATFETYVKLNKRIPPEMLMSVASIESAGRLADTIVAQLNLKLEDKQKALELNDPGKRLEQLLSLMSGEIEILQVEKKIRSRVKKQMEKSQKEYYLNEQMQAIQKELGEKDDFQQEVVELEKAAKNKPLSKEAAEKVKKEIKKLKMMSPMSAEATVVRNYVDWILSLPWLKYSTEKTEIAAAEKILEQDHYGLEKVKERILEYLAVQSLVENQKGPILCLVGPPGVGKTSLARSIAKAMHRNFVRISLGGVRDEAEVRGHRRTYIGAMPGKIIQAMKKAETSNPVFLLDEIDKMSTDFRGDPSSALLEVLDPEQNVNFGDHYLEVDYDLSKTTFVTTANSLHTIPRPLLDRMEIISIEGYTEEEKFEIARRYLVPKCIEANGLKGYKVEITDSAIKATIRGFTKEAGVRSLERELSNICRKVARKLLSQKKRSLTVTAKNLKDILGAAKYKFGKIEEKHEIGLTNGMAWTEVGGDLLVVEVSVVPGKGKFMITGQLGEVMRESAQAAMSYIRSRAVLFGLNKDFIQSLDVHIHVPEGAIPKDGPSAGITMATSIVSALTKVPVRKDVAMTGEITLRGRVLPIGGLREKVLAAHRGGIKTIICPKENEKDLKDIPKKVLGQMKIILVDHVDQVIVNALDIKRPEDIFKTRTHGDAQGIKANYSGQTLHAH
jgi:ATP-dependent Lon protease